jgi:hypothetical protein
MHMAGNHSSGKFFNLEKLWPLDVRRGKGNYLTIIFIHGLQILNRTDAWRSTWIKRGTDVCWPEAWLPEDLGKEKVRVLSVSYDASQWGIRDSVQDFGTNFVDEIIARYYGHQLHLHFHIIIMHMIVTNLIIWILTLAQVSNCVIQE